MVVLSAATCGVDTDGGAFVSATISINNGNPMPVVLRS